MNPHAWGHGKTPNGTGIAMRISIPRKRLYIGCACCVAGAVIIVAISYLMFLAGAVIGTSGTYSRLAEQRKSEIEEYLGNHPGLFNDLEVVTTSDGGAIILGTVRSDETMALLESGITKRFGTLYVEEILRNVSVETAL